MLALTDKGLQTIWQNGIVSSGLKKPAVQLDTGAAGQVDVAAPPRGGCPALTQTMTGTV